MVSFFGLETLATVLPRCRNITIRVKCFGGSAVHKGVVFSMCRTRGCPSDDWVQVRSQVDDMKFLLARLFEAAGQPLFVWFVDFTMGSDLWAEVPRTNLARLRQIAYETMQEYFDEVWGFPVKFGMDVVAQYWSSRNPGRRYVPHIHAIVPRLFVEAASGRALSDDRMKYIDESRVKEIWRRRVEAEYGQSHAKVAGLYAKFSCKVSYTQGVGSQNRNSGLDKRLRYMYCGIAWDYNLFAIGGKDYSRWNREWFRWSLTYNHKRHQPYGLMAARNLSSKSEFVRRIDLDIGTKRERDKIRRSRGCPHCNQPVVVDRDIGENAQYLTRKEASEAGLEVWKSRFADEDVKYRDFVSYHGGGETGVQSE